MLITNWGNLYLYPWNAVDNLCAQRCVLKHFCQSHAFTALFCPLLHVLLHSTYLEMPSYRLVRLEIRAGGTGIAPAPCGCGDPLQRVEWWRMSSPYADLPYGAPDLRSSTTPNCEHIVSGPASSVISLRAALLSVHSMWPPARHGAPGCVDANQRMEAHRSL